MNPFLLTDVLLLYALGVLGWRLASFLRLPAPAILGAILFVGALRMTAIPIPPFPDTLGLVLQMAIGIMIGGNFNKKTVHTLRGLAFPAVAISFWAIAVAFVSGFVISTFTHLDIYTAILGSSVGGLPEMTVLALSTEADVLVVVLFHLFRLLVTIFLFPILARYFTPDWEEKVAANTAQNPSPKESTGEYRKPQWKHIALSVCLAAGGGSLFLWLGIPAGALVGSLIFTIIGSLLGWPLFIPSKQVLNWFLVGIGLMVAGQFTQESFFLLISGELLLPLLLSMIIILTTSFGLGYIMFRITQWSFLTAFLSTAPAGLTFMSTLAMQTGNDPIPVSLMHLCRVLVLKLALPFIFMFFYQ